VTHAAITGWGKCLPPAVLTNQDLATFLDTNDEWITSRTGIKERRISHVPLGDLAYVSTMRALAAAGLDPAKVELIVFGSCSFDDQVPNQASGLQVRIGSNAPRWNQHRMHELSVCAEHRERTRAQWRRAQCRRGRRRGHQRVHGLGQSRRLRAVRRWVRECRDRGDGARRGCAVRAARVRQRCA
jgi:hypothetical protein